MKKFYAIILAFIMTLSLAACSNDTPSPSTQQEEQAPIAAPAVVNTPKSIPVEQSEADELQTYSEIESLQLAVYNEFYDILRAAIDEFGVGHSEEVREYLYEYSGVIHAELIDFDKDGLPELLFVYSDGSIEYGAHIVVYGYISGKAEMLAKHEMWPTHTGVDITVNSNGITYFHYYEGDDFGIFDDYYSLIDGKWAPIIELSLLDLWHMDENDSVNDEQDEYEWFVNDNKVDEAEYVSAREALGIVSTRTIWWGSRGVDLITVEEVFEKLKSGS